MSDVIFSQISLQDLKNVFSEIVRNEILKLNESSLVKTDLPELLSRRQTSEFLGISKVTLWKYTKAGKLQSYHLSGQIRYKRDEVLKAVQEVKNLKCKKND